MEKVLSIKPHHFIDIITNFGAGKEKFEPHPYGHAVHTVSKDILSNHTIVLAVELGADDICAPCLHNRNGVCDDIIDTSYRPDAPSLKREWNLLIDRRWCERLKIKQDNRISANKLCELVSDCAGDITDIYREIPAHLTAERARKLKEGIRKYFLNN